MLGWKPLQKANKFKSTKYKFKTNSCPIFFFFRSLHCKWNMARKQTVRPNLTPPPLTYPNLTLLFDKSISTKNANYISLESALCLLGETNICQWIFGRGKRFKKDEAEWEGFVGNSVTWPLPAPLGGGGGGRGEVTCRTFSSLWQRERGTGGETKWNSLSPHNWPFYSCVYCLVWANL